MISVVVCSRTGRAAFDHQPNVAKTIGAKYEFISVDNSKNTYSLAAAYNHALEKAAGEIVVFMHEDAFFMSANWGAALGEKFHSNPDIGLIGVAGTQYLDETIPLWARPGRPFVKGRIIHELQNGNEFFMSLYSVESGDAEVVAVDGVFMAARASALQGLRLDDAAFDGFHFYDLDLCMQLRRRFRLMVTSAVLIKHFSHGSFGDDWKKYAERFREKYRHELPANCSGRQPDWGNIVRYESVDLKGRIMQDTIR